MHRSLKSSVRAFVRGFVIACALAALVSGPADAGAADDDLSEFESPTASTAALRSLLDEDGPTLPHSSFATRSGDVAWCSRDDAKVRGELGAQVRGVLVQCADVLRGLGWNLPDTLPALTVVRVRVSGAPPSVVVSSDGRTVLIRENDVVRVVEPARPPTRPDGLPLERDAVAACNRARVWASALAASRRSVSVADVAAARIVRWAVPGSGVPPWFVEGLVAWTASRVASGPDASHVCRGWSAPATSAVEPVLAAAAVPPAAARPFLGRLIGVLVAGRTDVPQRMSDLMKSPTPADAALTRSFGRPLAEVVAAANAQATPATLGATCDEAGTIACTACGGGGRHDLACPECGGSGNVCCPACQGVDSCVNCEDGWVHFNVGKKKKCKFCTAGRTKCLACTGSLKAACRACSGSGRTSRACLACRAGRVACPEGGVSAADPVPCAWCADAKIVVNCDDCGGAGYAGCGNCLGTRRMLCDECIGTGEIRMVYTDGTIASATKCADCGGRGFSACDECTTAKSPCAPCAGKGRGTRDAGSCRACGGAGTLPLAEPSLLRVRSADLTDEEIEAQKSMVDGALAFLVGCRARTGEPFALRKLRRGSDGAPRALMEPSAFANAMVLWTLATAGRGKDDPELAGAWRVLYVKANEFAAGTEEDMGSQAAGLTLRALLSGGEDPRGPTVRALVERIVKAQHPTGFWGTGLVDPKDPDDALDTLFVAESLRLARLRGAAVPGVVWQKLYRAACALLDSRTLSPKNDWLLGGDVASGVALVIMAKEGSLGSKATAYDYAALPQVKKGMAWLDRHFDIAREPQFSRGARCPGTSDAGYMAWLFSVQRLGMLLKTEELGGERWYASAIRHLRTLRYKDGSFEERSAFALNGPVRTTCAVVLFLLRATPPITDSGDD